MEPLQRLAFLLGKLRERNVAAVLLFAALAATIFAVSQKTTAVYILDGEKLTVTYTIESDPHKILKKEGIELAYGDVVEASAFQYGVGEVRIGRGFPVLLTIGQSETQPLTAKAITVEELLAEHGISPDGNDLVSPPLQTTLAPGERVDYHRVDYQTRVEEGELPYPVEEQKTSLLAVGKRRVVTQGQKGYGVSTYLQKFVDGQLQKETLLDSQAQTQPVTETVLVGARVPISPLDFGYRLDESGAPIGYKKVYRNQRATGYSARVGAGTASGRFAVPGHVAVRADMIPYGTKLYIATPDRSFIYGYAVAADTGVALMEDVIDVDLFYATFLESQLNGRRLVDIYVLD